MTETPLESIRRQIREAEERQKKATESNSTAVSASNEGSTQESAASAELRIQSEEEPLSSLSNEWAAYGQMTPGYLSELSDFLSDSVRGVSGYIRTQDKPELTKFLQKIDRVRYLLYGWAKSSSFLSAVEEDGTYADLVQKALIARKAELSRWGIKAGFEDATTETDIVRGFPLLFRVLLHVMQFCVEQLRENYGESRMLVRVQKAGDRLETMFLCETSRSSKSDSFSMTESFSNESLHSKNVELRIAQKLLDAIGGTLVLENISDTQLAIRIYLSSSALSVDRNRNRKSGL
jgi:hypothetical protein